jgi:hypothetical protein
VIVKMSIYSLFYADIRCKGGLSNLSIDLRIEARFDGYRNAGPGSWEASQCDHEDVSKATF